jgi:prepilin-type processing-associated H-X9-DG protein
LEEFARACSSRQYRPDRRGGYKGDVIGRGRPWIYGDASITFYNHVLPPNSPSCFNGSAVQHGAYSAASLHADGVNVLFGDGHVSFVEETVALAVWRDFGSMY